MKILTNLYHKVGTIASDFIIGTSLDDTIIGGKGNDTITGDDGQDVYYYRIGDGDDFLRSNYQVNDKLAFGAGVSPQDITVSISGNEKILAFSQGGSVTIQNSAIADGNNPKLQFSDGSIYQISGTGLSQVSGADAANIFSVPDYLIEPLQPVKVQHSAFHIEFDYSYDTSGWFDEVKKQNLEYAASLWSDRINQDWTNIAAGTQINVLNPNLGRYETKVLTRDVDDIVIYVGAIDLNSSSWSGTATAMASSNSSFTYAGRPNTTSAYQPAVGAITFSTNPQWVGGGQRTWFFDSTPEDQSDVPGSQDTADFVLIAAHELGHILGIGSGSQAYANLIADQTLYGANSVAVYGAGVPVSGPQGHIGGNVTINGDIPLLAPGGTVKRTPSVLDYAILSDIGYNIDFDEEINLKNTVIEAVEAGIGNDILRGNNLNNTLYGLSGNDQLWGYTGGNDTLIGGSGSNAYWWGSSEGNDLVTSTGAKDAIYFYNFAANQRAGSFNAAGDMLFGCRTGNSDKITIAGWRNQATNNRVQSLVFSDSGTMKAYAWNDHASIEVNLFDGAYTMRRVNYLECIDTSNAILRGSTGDDVIKGGAGDDVVWGGTGGNDTLSGGAGMDAFWWGNSDGNDKVTDGTAVDKIMLYSGLATANVSVAVSGTSLTLIGTSGNRLEVSGWASSGLNKFVFGRQETASNAYKIVEDNGTYRWQQL